MESVKSISSLLSDLYGGLVDEPLLLRAQSRALEIMPADCFCLWHFPGKGLAPEPALSANCRAQPRRRLGSLFKNSLPAFSKFPLGHRVYTCRQQSELVGEGWQRFLLEVCQGFWEHSGPGFYLLGSSPLQQGIGISAFRRRVRGNRDFGKEERETALALCPHWGNYLRLRQICSFSAEHQGVDCFFRGCGASKRELEVARLVFRGDDVSGIARGLRISPDTVRDHLKNIYHKVGCHSRGELFASFFRAFKQTIRHT